MLNATVNIIKNKMPLCALIPKKQDKAYEI